MLGLGLGLQRFNFTNRVPIPVLPEFIMEIDTTKAGSANTTFILPLDGSSAYNFDVDWGDTNSETVITNTDKTHVYSVGGTYTVKISGTFPSIYFNNVGDKLKLLDVSNWGDIVWANMMSAFYGCANATFTATDIPEWSNVIFINRAFRDCVNFNQSVSNWNTSNLIDMNSMFRGCTNFNQDVSNFNTSEVTDMSGMFYLCTNFNQDISSFNIESTVGMSIMLANTSFDTTNYDLLLVAWEAQTEKPNVTFHAGTAKYSAGTPTTARDALELSGWLITDGGQI